MKTNWKKEEKDILKRIENIEDFTASLGLNTGGDKNNILSFYEYCKKKNSPLTPHLKSYINREYNQRTPPILWIFLSLLIVADILMGIFYGFYIWVPLAFIEIFSAFVGAYIMMLMEQEEKKVKEND